ncbi:XRE family transcriptional regulator [Cellulomonas fimi]|uniref:XRE family transcriptional regulator n=1 Tax=Cellulomonas fimi TaxID=1708 RepID=UPI0023590138|nr:XRE family transcriptional regulator [Cellulomonas fimi]
MDDFGGRLRERRERRGMSQRDLAATSGVHQPTIAAIESGRRRPSAAVRAALTRALDVRPSEALRTHRSAVEAAIARHRGTDPQVFGSVARGEDVPGSDLDLMISFPQGTDLIDVIDLVDELEQITGVHVDVISGRGTGPVMDRARREAVPL